VISWTAGAEAALTTTWGDGPRGPAPPAVSWIELAESASAWGQCVSRRNRSELADDSSRPLQAAVAPDSPAVGSMARLVPGALGPCRPVATLTDEAAAPLPGGMRPWWRVAIGRPLAISLAPGASGQGGAAPWQASACGSSGDHEISSLDDFGVLITCVGGSPGARRDRPPQPHCPAALCGGRSLASLVRRG